MLADNIKYLRKTDARLYDAIKTYELTKNGQSVYLETTKNQLKTIRFQNEKQSIYLHSKYDPIREAESIIDKLEETEQIDANTHVVFYGLGLGYHIDSFCRRFPGTVFSIYEPSIEILSHYLNEKNIDELPLKELLTIQCDYSPDSINSLFIEFNKNASKRVVISILPSYQKLFKKEYEAFLNAFRNFIRGRRLSLNVNLAYKKRWVYNSVENFKEVLNSPNILMDNGDLFKGKTAILVSAGPSLDFEIENLKRIKAEGLAFIFSVGSSINTLLSNGIYPDAICTYDPSQKNQEVFKKANEMEITTVPMIFGSSLGYEVLQNYKGPKYHMITSQDEVSSYFLKMEDGSEIKIVSDAPTIAVVTLELLHKLGFDQIILVGQNLAYYNEKTYASGVDYHPVNRPEESQKAIKVKDVEGRDIETTEGYLSMKELMEHYIKAFHLNVINTTIGGAHIVGTQFVPLKEAFNRFSMERVVEGNEFGRIHNKNKYDDEYISKQLEIIKQAFKKHQLLITEIKRLIDKLNNLIKNNNKKQVSDMHQKLDSKILELESNEFFKSFALPMNRVEYELLVNEALRVREEKNEFLKAKQIIRQTETFINLLYLDKELNQKMIEVLTDTIENYRKENEK